MISGGARGERFLERSLELTLSNEDILKRFRERRLLTQSEARICHSQSIQTEKDIVDIILEQGFVADESETELRRLCQSDLDDIALSSPLYTVALPKPGDVVEGFEILEILGEGGMGAVYKARGYLPGQQHLDLPPDLYALKVMNTHSEQALQRFEREAQALAAVDLHPNIVRIHSFSKHGRRPFLVLDWVNGETLEDVLCSDESWTERRILETAVKIADALQFIHDRGILHRDLKPGNVLIRRDDGEVFLSDFGLAKVLHKETLTSTEEVLGTPVYMAPEQLCGDEDLGPEADIWSLGVILYELGTGRLPFDSENSVELAESILQDDPDLPTERNPQLSPALEAVIWKCLAKEPEDRYQSAEELAEEFQAILATKPVMARLPGRLRRAFSRFARRHGVTSVYVLVTIIILLLASTFILVVRAAQRFRIEEQRKEVAAAFIPVKKRILNKDGGFVRHATTHFLDCVPFEGRLPGGPCRDCDQWSAIQSDWRDYLEQRKELELLLGDEEVSGAISLKNHRECAQIMGLLEDFKRIKKNEALSAQITADSSSAYQLRAGFRALKRGRPLSAKSHFLKLNGKLEDLAPLGFALVATQRREWNLALTKLSLFLQTHSENSRLSQFAGALKEERFLHWIRRGPREAWPKQKRFLEAYRRQDEDWSRLNQRVQALFSEPKTSMDQKALSYRRLQRARKSFPALEKTPLDADFHFALGILASDEGHRRQAQYHFLCAQLRGTKELIPVDYRWEDLQRQLAQHLTAEDKDGMRAAFEMLIVFSRAGIYSFVAREIWLLALHRRGVMSRALSENPGDPWILFWRGMREIPDPNKDLADMRSARRDMNSVILHTETQDIFRAVALFRRAQLNIWLASASGQNKLFNEGMRDLKRSIERGHPAPDQVYKFWGSLEENPRRRVEIEMKRYQALEKRWKATQARQKNSIGDKVDPLMDEDYQGELKDLVRNVIRHRQAMKQGEEARNFLLQQKEKLRSRDYLELRKKLLKEG